MKRMVRKLFLSGLAMLIAMLVGEFVVRVVVPQDLSGTWLVYGKRGNIVNKNSGVARAQSGDRIVSYRFNDHHLRGGPISDAGKRVLVLGDSFTFGWLLEETNTYVYLLGTYADRDFGADTFQLLNGGVGGWGISDCMAFLEEFGEAIRPSVVIDVINADDIGRVIRSSLYTLDPADKMKLLATTNTAYRFSAKTLVNAVPCYQWVLEHSHFLQLIRRSVTWPSRHSANARGIVSPGQALPVPHTTAQPEQLKYGRDVTHALFRKMNTWCRDHDAILLVTSTGFLPLDHRDATLEPTLFFMQSADDFFHEEGIPFHDISSAVQADMQPDPKRFLIPRDRHPNEAAQLLIAKHMWSWLKGQLAPLASTTTSRNVLFNTPPN